MSINRAALRSIWFKVELVGNAIAIGIIQNRFGELHMARGIDFAIGIIQRVKPPERFNRFFTNIIVDANTGITVTVPMGSQGSLGSSVFLPFLTT